MGPGREAGEVSAHESRADDAPVLAGMLDASPYIALLLDGDGVVRWVNDAVERHFGYTVEEALGTNILDHVDTEWDPAALSSVAAAFDAEDGLRLPAVFQGIRKDGSRGIFEAWASSQRNHPVLQGLVVYVRRWDERVLLDLAFESLAAGEPLAVTLGLLVEVMASETLEAHGVVMHELRRGVPGQVVAHAELPDLLRGHEPWPVEGSAAASTPVAPDLADGLAPRPTTPWTRAVASGERQALHVDDLPEPLRSAAKAAGHDLCWAWPVPTSDDAPVDACLVAWRKGDQTHPDFTRARLLDSLVRLARLAFERERTLRTLEHAASHDPLTRVANRARFYERLDRALADPTPGGRVGVLYLDLDGFKPVNDRFGHGAGDEVLAAVANRLTRTVREGDLVARVGGDEFAVLCPNVRTPAELSTLAERLVGVIAQPYEVRGRQVPVGVSIGASLAPRASTTSDLLVEAADRALYRVKGAGKGGWWLEELDDESAAAEARDELAGG